MSCFRTLLALLLLTAIPFATSAQNRKLTKKQLLKERIELQKTIDSLKSIIEGGALEMSDTTQFEEDTEYNGINYVDSEDFANAAPGSNPDSLMNMWYIQKNLTLDIADRNLDSVTLTSNIPDEVYMERLNRINSFIPLSYNSVVRNHIIYYTEKMPSKAAQILGLSAYYLPQFEEIFDYYGLPKELKAMAIIESALNPVAVSRARAKGMWQFMYRTALQYNLKINSYIDERLDPVASAHAAAKYLRDSYTIFGDWFLAISSYNCGVGNVNKAIRRAGSRDFWKIYPYLPRETRGYVPSFIAALYMLEYYKEHNMQPAQLNMPAHIDTFKVHKNLHFEQISAVVGVPMDDLKNYNPQYIEHIIPGNSGEQILKLPYNYTNAFIEKEKEVYTYKDSIYFNPITKESIKKNASLSSGGNITHVVKRGETLGHIAMKYRVSVKNLMRWNGLTSKSVLRIGQRLKINGGTAPAVTSSGGGSKASGGSAATSKSGGYEWYTIKKGDTLLGIAYKFSGVSLNDILRLNGLTKNSKIYPGRKIKIKKL
ncbi:MAG: LysM peptidoglycan-binding domain-containing protein [Bacteroidales bacterium]|nr:LysM peptidoglycan-binding domain-containing protein [Bacteroidales bacterium]MBO7269444.1 LysM peptidoglycan-binding domain-containing protein [Bacteroidales bacterium]